MISKQKCCICFNFVEQKHVSIAFISPWIRDLTKMTNRFSKYKFCTNCKIGYFTKRYSKNEMNNIYSDYRGSNYFAVRKKWEKWYNYEFFKNESSIDFAAERKSVIQDFLKSILSNQIKTVVDIGGDKGQYIPDFSTKTQRFVIDLSNRELIPGVKKLNSLEEIERCDLIMFCHVLEHVSDPINELKKLVNKCEALYVEVPYGRPKINLIRKLGVFPLLQLILTFFPKAYSKFSAAGTGRVNKKHYWLNQSEHINFFEEDSFDYLSKVLNKKFNYRIIDIPTPDGKKATVLQALFN